MESGFYRTTRYQNDFSGGVTTAVNHNGNSDSTGAVTGNIIGAIVGYQGIDEKWKEKLERSDVMVMWRFTTHQMCMRVI